MRFLIPLTAIADSLAISWLVIPRLSIRKGTTSKGCITVRIFPSMSAFEERVTDLSACWSAPSTLPGAGAPLQIEHEQRRICA
jgi:hypothetical protein